ncbi:MAG: hypothetical protein K6E95_03615 [Lachnospiraceae bacterium]|nr:hypothetical protein [Lachnospiraceae bacterium]
MVRTEIFTGAFLIILTAVLTVGELSLKEDRNAMRDYERFSYAVEKAVDDACEYLGIVPENENGLTKENAEYVESIFIEAMAAALGRNVNLCRGQLVDMTAAFAVFDGKGRMISRPTGRGGEWKLFENIKNEDEAAEAIMEIIKEGCLHEDGFGGNINRAAAEAEKRLFLPDETGLTGYRASSGRSILVCMVCNRRSGLTGEKGFVCIRNACLRKKKT